MLTKTTIKKIIYEFLLLLFVGLIFINFFFGGGRIPSGSMEPTLLKGDTILKNVCVYGGKTPTTPLSIPMTGPSILGFPTYSNWIKLPSYRLSGYGGLKKGDVITFYATSTPEGGSTKHIPPSKADEFVKRLVAFPGERVKIENAMIYVNGFLEPGCIKRQYRVQVQLSKPLSLDFLEKHTLKYHQGPKTASYDLILTYAQLKEYHKEKEKNGIEEVFEDEEKQTIFYLHKGSENQESWNGNEMEEIEVPYKGMVIKLNKHTHPLYIETLQNTDPDFFIEEKGEGDDKEVRFYLNKQEIKAYSFKEGHIFAIGDNLHDSYDSRKYGFVPISRINARVDRVLMSFKNENVIYNFLTFNWRLSRFFKKVI